MCGIAGIVGPGAGRHEPAVRAALALLAHRGPDGEGIHRTEGAIIGMRRLAIIDLEGGHQPVYDESREIAAVCNGEIYDYIELFDGLRARGHELQSATDANVIPHLYQELGVEAAREWRGMFAAALWDGRTRRLVLWRDRVGKKPLFYAVRSGTLAFASELPALLALLGEQPAIEPAALREYLQLGFVPHPMTIHREVWALPPACRLEFEPGGPPRVTRYWDPPEAAPFAGTREDALAILDTALRDAVRVRLRSDVPLGLFLSGGIDSALVGAYAAEAGARDLMSFVVGVDDPALDESVLARETARHLGLAVEPIALRVAPLEIVERVALAYGQPFADPSAIPTMLVSQAAARHRRVVLTGDGGDEVFAGYRRHGLAGIWRHPPRGGVAGLGRVGRAVTALGGRRSAAGFAARALRGWGLPEGERYLAWTVDLLDAAGLKRLAPRLEGAAPRQARIPVGGIGPVERRCGSLREFLWTDTRLILADDLLPKMDIATMAFGVEARAPLLDVPLLEFTRTLPEAWLRRGRRTKPLLRSIAARKVPASVAAAPKRGFEVPIARWLDGELRELVADTLLAPDARVREYLDAKAVAAFVGGRDEFAGNRAQTVWTLLMLELFLRGAGRARVAH